MGGGGGRRRHSHPQLHPRHHMQTALIRGNCRCHNIHCHFHHRLDARVQEKHGAEPAAPNNVGPLSFTHPTSDRQGVPGESAALKPPSASLSVAATTYATTPPYGARHNKLLANTPVWRYSMLLAVFGAFCSASQECWGHPERPAYPYIGHLYRKLCNRKDSTVRKKRDCNC